MTTKILVPLDGSLCAERALTYLHWLGLPETTEVILVSVIDPAYYVYGAMNYSTPDLLTSTQADTEKYLQFQSSQLQQEGYKVTTKMTVGDAGAEILQAAQAQHVDMIVMATHGRSGFMRWILGSVAERVISQATVPTFLVRDEHTAPAKLLSRIMVPLDGSEFAEQALTTATELAKRMKSELFLLNAFDVVEKVDAGLYMETQEEMDDAIQAWREYMGGYLANKTAELRAQGIVTQTRMVLEDAATAIEDVAAMESVGLIVMSTHGRSGLQRWLYGSVANKVLRNVTCPLLLVRPPKAVAESPLVNIYDMLVPRVS
jgi:nucleotide-binding universal stress UspA family protein